VLRRAAIGCADPVVPRGAWMRRDGDKATVACNFTTQTWHIVCQHDSWFGSIDNCTVGTLRPSCPVSTLTTLLSIHLVNQLVNPSLSLFLLSSSITPSLFHSRLKIYLSTNPFHRRLLLPTGLPHDNGTRPDLSRSSICFQFHILIFCLFRVVD